MKGLVLLTVEPFTDALALIQITLLPNMIGNSVGAALFVSVLSDFERYGSASSNQAFRIARRMTKTLQYGLNARSADIIIRIIRKESNIAAVAMADAQGLLAYTGIGADHHKLGDTTIMRLTEQVMQSQETLYLDGHEQQFNCLIDHGCLLNSALITPLIINHQVIAVLLLFETEAHFFPKMDKALGIDLARFVEQHLLSTQHQQLLHESRYEALKAQVKPHFLANALNTIAVILRRDQQQARDLLTNLAAFMRRTIDNQDLTILVKELSHLQDYLAIETARFGDKLTFIVNSDAAVADAIIPNFIVQPMVENAIKHGTSKMLSNSIIEIKTYLADVETVHIDIIDNAGLYSLTENKINPSTSIGLDNVCKRIKHLCDDTNAAAKYGVSIDCIAGSKTTVTLIIPYRV
jgi:two-component system LytT family sensor kinase